MYDAIVVGARCAGSATALLLARRGYRVLLLDKVRFPSDTVSTHVIFPQGVACLERWGVLPAVAASGCPPVSTITFDMGEVCLTGNPPPVDGISTTYGPRRTILDPILIRAAVDAGVEFREASGVEELLFDDDRVSGVACRGNTGSPVNERARVVIGADGMRSLVARAVNAPEYDVRAPLGCFYYSYWSAIPLDGIRFGTREGVAAGLLPTNDGLVCVVEVWRNSEFAGIRTDIEGNFLRSLELFPWHAERVRAGRREDRFHGTADLPNFLRRPYGAGWALVGDAGYHRDPITAQGISDAFIDAESLASAVDAGLSGRRSLEGALREHEQRRNERVRAMYDPTCDFAQLNVPPPEVQAVHRALVGNQADTNRFIGAIVGTVPIPEFFAPGNLQRIVALAGSAGAASA